MWHLIPPIILTLGLATQVPPTSKNPEGFKPKGWKIVENSLTKGDLNGDGIADLAIAFDAPEVKSPGDFPERLLVVALGDGKSYRCVAADPKAAGCAGCGGIKAPNGDPLESIKIERGILVIRQWGGSRHTWGITERYRYQNGHLERIGETYDSLDTLGEDGQTTWDYNLSTGLVTESFTQDPFTEASKAKTLRKNYRLLRAGKMSQVPKISDLWPGQPISLGKSDLKGEVKGDFSAKLWGLWQGKTLWIKAEISDSRTKDSPGLRFKDGKGKEIKPLEVQNQPILGAHVFTARLDLEALRRGGDPTRNSYGDRIVPLADEKEDAIPLTLDILGTQSRTLTNSKSGQGLVVLCTEPGLPKLKNL